VRIYRLVQGGFPWHLSLRKQQFAKANVANAGSGRMSVLGDCAIRGTIAAARILNSHC